MLLNGPCPGVWGWDPSLANLQVGQEGMEKLADARGCFLGQRIQIQTPEQWIIHISLDQKGVCWCFKGKHCQALTGLFIAGVHINAAKQWRGKTKRYCECNHLLHYLKLLWIFMKLTVDTRTHKTMFGEWQNTLGYTKPFELTLTTPPADGPYRFCCMLNPPCWVSIRDPTQAPWTPLAE